MIARETTLHITPARHVRGRLRVPGDKSISHRYLMFAAIARGTTRITNLAPGADVASTATCFRGLGVTIRDIAAGAVEVAGRGWSGLAAADAPLDAGNSGTTMRLLAGLLAGRPGRATIVGDESLQRRPMRRIIDPLTAMGARITARDGRAPLLIEGGGLHGVTWEPEVPSAQVKSALMLAGLSATGATTIVEPIPTRDHTERAFPLFGLRFTRGGADISVPGGQEASAPSGELAVAGDPSSAAAWAAASSALPGSDVRIDGVLLNPRRLGFVQALRAMGADIDVEPGEEAAGEAVGSLRIRHRGHGTCRIAAADVPDLIDELPVLAARAALGAALEVTGAGELRVKESDRIATLVAGLRRLGVIAEERPDGFLIDGSRPPTGGVVDAGGDHRMVMAFALVGLGATGPTTITGADAVAVSYPGFSHDLAAVVS